MIGGESGAVGPVAGSQMGPCVSRVIGEREGTKKPRGDRPT